MSHGADDDWRGLLLHRLPAEDAARLERKLLSDDAALAALRDAEIDLHDDYARLQLTADEHRAFRRHVLVGAAAEARQRLSQAMKPLPPDARRATRFETVARPRSRRSLWTTLIGATIAAALFTAIRLFQPALLSGAAPKPAAASTAAEPTLLLLAIGEPGTVRPEVRVVLRPGASGLRLQAEVTHREEARLYRIRLLGDDGDAKPLLDIDGLPLQTVNGYRFVEALVPATLLAGGGARIVQVDSLPPAGAFRDRWTIRARTTDEPPFALPSP